MGIKEALAQNLYFDRQHNIDAVKILPGEYYVTERGLLLVTTLGSCVCACIRDRVAKIGGMNHFMLPGEAQDINDPLSDSARYGAYAMEILVNHLQKMGANRSNLEAKVFGGGAVMRSLSLSNVGDRNADFVLKFLAMEKIPVVAKDLLDIYPRKVYYFPESGLVRVKKLKRMQNSRIASREFEYRARLLSTKIEGDVELFIDRGTHGNQGEFRSA